jgi:hypothetical protein
VIVAWILVGWWASAFAMATLIGRFCGLTTTVGMVPTIGERGTGWSSPTPRPETRHLTRGPLPRSTWPMRSNSLAARSRRGPT